MSSSNNTMTNENLKETILATYSNGQPILMAVDCIIFGVENNQLKLLIFKREVEPLAGHWSLLGRFVRPDESVDTAAENVLHELTGIRDIYMEQLHCFGDSNRDSGGRVVSVAYWSLIKVDQNQDEFSIDHHEAKWVPFDQVPELILDHGDMVTMAIENLRERARFHPIGFELVPKQFTLLQLLKVYEAIFSHPIDDRNFRKKILKSGLLTKLEKKDMSTSKKGSFLYEFNEETYQKLLKEGYNFEF
ncbi:NUDIX hydrolase [Roseivirga pacifica]|uniref:NUDIX hydrolase n=1 Tax=Roseivirga pacifica TaxID=1267423 RepID=UPI00227B74FF|nr:NUDIX domain-containing protein [Roseivirga pacifica]